MKVHALIEFVWHEMDGIVGVYSTVEAAEKARDDKLAAAKAAGEPTHTYTIEEFELDLAAPPNAGTVSIQIAPDQNLHTHNGVTGIVLTRNCLTVRGWYDGIAAWGASAYLSDDQVAALRGLNTPIGTRIGTQAAETAPVQPGRDTETGA